MQSADIAIHTVFVDGFYRGEHLLRQDDLMTDIDLTVCTADSWVRNRVTTSTDELRALGEAFISAAKGPCREAKMELGWRIMGWDWDDPSRSSIPFVFSRSGSSGAIEVSIEMALVDNPEPGARARMCVIADANALERFGQAVRMLADRKMLERCALVDFVPDTRREAIPPMGSWELDERLGEYECLKDGGALESARAEIRSICDDLVASLPLERRRTLLVGLCDSMFDDSFKRIRFNERSALPYGLDGLIEDALFDRYRQLGNPAFLRWYCDLFLPTRFAPKARALLKEAVRDSACDPALASIYFDELLWQIGEELHGEGSCGEGRADVGALVNEAKDVMRRFDIPAEKSAALGELERFAEGHRMGA